MRTSRILLCLLLLWTTFLEPEVVSEEVTLTVFPMQVPDPSSVAVTVDAGLLGDAFDSSAVSGVIVANLEPTALNAATAQITAMNLVLDDSTHFELGGFLLPTVTASAAGGDLMVELIGPGEQGELFRGEFQQFENLMGVRGAIQTSVQADPLDLAGVEPTLVDFPVIGLATDRRAMSLSTALETEVIAPIQSGILTFNISILIEGAVAAVGEIPAAEYVWSPSANVGDRFRFGDTVNWARNGVAGTDSLPVEIDHATFAAGANVDAVQLDLDGERQMRAARFEVLPGGYTFSNGVFEVQGGTLEMAADLEFAADARLSSPDWIRVSQFGAHDFPVLQIQGISSPIEMLSGGITGTGEVEALRIGDNAVLYGMNDSEHPLRVVGDLVIEGSFIVPDSVAEIESSLVTLMEYGSLDISNLREVSMANRLYSPIAEHTYSLHWSDGLFYTVEFATTQAVLARNQATAGDANGDGQVNFADFLAMSSSFGQAGDWTRGDFNGSGTIDFADFLELSSNFSVTGVAVVPEPTASGLLLMIALPLAGGLRRKYRQQADSAHKKGASDVPNPHGKLNGQGQGNHSAKIRQRPRGPATEQDNPARHWWSMKSSWRAYVHFSVVRCLLEKGCG